MRRLPPALLALAQVLAPAVLVAADPPPAPASHVDHLGTPEGTGCRPIHDEFHCLACTMLSHQPLGTATTVPAAAPAPPERLGGETAGGETAPTAAPGPLPGARGPPSA